MPWKFCSAIAACCSIACATSSLDEDVVMPALELPVALEVVTSASHTCSRHEDGTVWCWGAGAAGQLGTGDDRNLARPAPVVGIDDAVGLAVGDDFGCVRRRDDSVACWGRGDNGQLAEHRGHLADVMVFGSASGQAWRQGLRGSAVPVDIPRASEAREIVAAGEHACVLQHSRRVWCWGRLAGTVLADAEGNGLALTGLGRADALSTGRDHICAKSRDRWRCWGRRVVERRACAGLPGCGLEVWEATSAPSSAGSGAHECRIDKMGRVACRGENAHGQLGIGDLRPSPTAEVILGYHRGRWVR